MALVTAAVASVAVGAYGAYQQKRAGDRAYGLARQQAGRQAFYDEQLRALLQDPSKIYEDPGYQEAFRQGTQAVERAGTLQGFTGSGNAAIALQRFGQSFAADYLNQQRQLLAGLSGAQVNPAQAMQVGAGQQAGAFQSMGNVLASLGYGLAGIGGTTFGGAGAGTGGFGAGTSVPGTMSTGGGYIVNVPGAGS